MASMARSRKPGACRHADMPTKTTGLLISLSPTLPPLQQELPINSPRTGFTMPRLFRKGRQSSQSPQRQSQPQSYPQQRQRLSSAATGGKQRPDAKNPQSGASYRYVLFDVMPSLERCLFWLPLLPCVSSVL